MGVGSSADALQLSSGDDACRMKGEEVGLAPSKGALMTTCTQYNHQLLITPSHQYPLPLTLR